MERLRRWLQESVASWFPFPQQIEGRKYAQQGRWQKEVLPYWRLYEALDLTESTDTGHGTQTTCGADWMHPMGPQVYLLPCLIKNPFFTKDMGLAAVTGGPALALMSPGFPAPKLNG